jgi:hypothetical protein
LDSPSFRGIFSAAEPSVTCQLTKDEAYYAAVFGMQGKRPYYAEDVLKISDLYLTTCSFSPIGAKAMREAFDSIIDGIPWPDMWLIDKEKCLAPLKKPRKLHKILALAVAYGCGPKKLVQIAFENGFIISMEVARAFYKRYWQWAPKIQAFGKRLETQFERDGYLVNPIGYRLTPDSSFHCFNAMIQSTVSGIMQLLVPMIQEACPWEQFVAIIHDEELSLCPNDKLEESRLGTQIAEQKLADTLKWDIRIGIGFAPGKSLYEAK